MALRIPRNFPSHDRGAKVDALNYELVQESAATLARLGRGVERALEALAAFDAAHANGGSAAAERDRLVAAAGEALWYYVVQREVMGLRDVEPVMRHLGVPREVRMRMGINPYRRREASSRG